VRRALGIVVVVLLTAAPDARALDVAYGAAATTWVRTRTPLPGDQGTIITGDLELDPVLDLALLFGPSVLAFQYAPQLIWREPQTGGRLLPLQRGRAGFTHRFSHATLLITEDAAWGLADIGSLRNPDGSLPGAVSEVQTLGGVPYERSATLVSLDGQPSSRVSLGASAGFAVSGSPAGTTNGLPLQWGPSGSLRARVLLTRLDGLSPLVSVFSSRFITGQEQLISTATATWDHQLLRTWSFTLGAGAALTRDVVVDPQQGTPGTYVEALPVGAVTTSWRDKVEHQALGLSGSFRVAPFADRFTGNVYERMEARAQADWKPTKDLTVMAAASGALAVGIGRAPQAGDRLVSGEASATWTLTTWLVLQAAGRVLWTEQPRLGTPGQTQAVVTVSVTVKEQDKLGL